MRRRAGIPKMRASHPIRLFINESLVGARCWQIPAGGAIENNVAIQEFAAAVLQRRARTLAATEDLAGLTPSDLHTVRLKAKHTRYTAEIFVPLFPGKPTRRFIHRLATLQNLLGALNDGTTAHRLLNELGGPGGRHAYASGLVLGFVAAHSSRLAAEGNPALVEAAPHLPILGMMIPLAGKGPSPNQCSPRL